MSHQDYEKARKIVKKKKEFYSHLTIYLIMSVFFFLLNVFSTDILWFQWPVIGWGIGVLFQYFDTFGYPGMGRYNSEEAAIEAELRRMHREKGAAMLPEDDDEALELPELQRQERPTKKWDDSELV